MLFVLPTFLKLLLNSPPPGSSDEVSLEQESEDDIHSSRSSLDRQSHHRANTTMHVCWYRNTSVSMTDHSVAVEVPAGRSSHISLCPPSCSSSISHFALAEFHLCVHGRAWAIKRPLHASSPLCMSVCPHTHALLFLQQGFAWQRH